MNLSELEQTLVLPPDIELPPWCQGARLAYSFELNKETPSNNDIRGLHPKAYQALRQWWCNKILARGLNGRKPEVPLERAALLVVRRSSKMLDWDNAYGGLKPVVDCLVVKTAKRSPNGLGLVMDDSPRHLPFPPMVLQQIAPPSQGSCHIALFDLS